MSIKRLSNTYTLGAGIFSRVTTQKVDEVIDQVNALVAGTHTPISLNVTGTITASMLQSVVITSTSAAGVTATLDTAANLGVGLNAKQGTVVDFIIDNTAGASTVTVVVNTGIVAATPIITGGATLTVGASTTQGIGLFRLVFSSPTAAVLFRIG